MNDELMIQKGAINEANDKGGDEEIIKNSIHWFKIAIIFILISLGSFVALIITIFAKSKESEQDNNWTIKRSKLNTLWTEQVNPNNPLDEYPRPQLKRGIWKNLNGLWDYNIVKDGSLKPMKPDGKILVPYPLESSLSGVMKNISYDQELYYEKSIEIPNDWKKNKRILLHFGAVDWYTQVYVNLKKVGEHKGGYSPFYFDITDYLDKSNSKDNIVVRVSDPTDFGYQPIGKQRLNPSGKYYTSVSGIWQTVWIEPVNQHYITNLRFYNDLDEKLIKFRIEGNTQIALPAEIILKYNDKIIDSKYESINSLINFTLSEENLFPWSPEKPNLYNIEITLFSQDNATIYDKIESYTALRKIEKRNDTNIFRIYLNNKPIFNIGILDNGYFPDGLYTPPTEKAMYSDLTKLKDLGFNTIRKHAKIESAIYYYYTDKLGFLVWQDMVPGDFGGNSLNITAMDAGTEKNRSNLSANNFKNEWTDIMNYCMFFQSIIIWIPFNEGWGQFNTVEVIAMTKNIDSSRLIDSASGGNYRNCGDILDLHSYPDPNYEPNDNLNTNKFINVIGEYGGLALEIKHHTWNENIYGHKILKSKDEITSFYEQYIDKLVDYSKTGISGAIYTQTTDVESELDGLMTYDRKEIKIFEDRIRAANSKLISTLNKDESPEIIGDNTTNGETTNKTKEIK